MRYWYSSTVRGRKWLWLDIHFSACSAKESLPFGAGFQSPWMMAARWVVSHWVAPALVVKVSGPLRQAPSTL
jgi:hypothetical protein